MPPPSLFLLTPSKSAFSFSTEKEKGGFEAAAFAAPPCQREKDFEAAGLPQPPVLTGEKPIPREGGNLTNNPTPSAAAEPKITQ